MTNDSETGRLFEKNIGPTGRQINLALECSSNASYQDSWNVLNSSVKFITLKTSRGQAK
jgi:hypothetical protein